MPFTVKLLFWIIIGSHTVVRCNTERSSVLLTQLLPVVTSCTPVVQDHNQDISTDMLRYRNFQSLQGSLMLSIHHLLNGLSTPREIPAFRVSNIRIRTQIEASIWHGYIHVKLIWKWAKWENRLLCCPLGGDGDIWLWERQPWWGPANLSSWYWTGGEGDEERGERGEERRGTRWVLESFLGTCWDRTPAGFSPWIWDVEHPSFSLPNLVLYLSQQFYEQVHVLLFHYLVYFGRIYS